MGQGGARALPVGKANLTVREPPALSRGSDSPCHAAWRVCSVDPWFAVGRRLTIGTMRTTKTRPRLIRVALAACVSLLTLFSALASPALGDDGEEDRARPNAVYLS